MFFGEEDAISAFDKFEKGEDRKLKVKTRIRRSIRAISPVISVLLMIAIAVAASLIAYAWIMGYIGGTTSKVGKAVLLQSFAAKPDGSELWVYVQNVGQGTVVFDPDACVYIDDVLKSASISVPAGGNPNTLSEGDTATITITGLSLDVSGSVRIKVVTSDGTFTQSSGIPKISTQANNAPGLDPIGNKGVNEMTLLAFTATASDPDPTDTLTFSLEGTVPAGASITAGGDFTWTPTEDQGPDDYTFTVRVTDNGSPALYDEEEITVTVTEGNQPPELGAIGDKSVDELVQLSFTATATDPDVPVQTLTFSLGVGAPSGASITAGGDFTWTPTEAQGPNTYPITIVVSDGSAEDSETIDVTVNEVNVAPVLDPIGDKTVDEETLLTFTATATDADDPANTLTFSLEGTVPSGASITAGGVFTWTPTEAQGPGDYSITVRVTDNGSPNLYDEETINVHVNEVATPVTVTLLSDGFEEKWASTDWDRETGQAHGGSYAMNSDNGNEDDFTSYNINAQGATSITVDFWYRHTDISDDDFEIWFYDGSNWDNVADLGDDGGDNTWAHYTQTTTDAQYLKSNFRIRFDTNLGSGEQVWVDDVSVTVTGGVGTAFGDDFELPDQWDMHWMTSNWFASSTAHSGSTSAGSDYDSEGAFTCNDLGTSSALSITVDFWYRLDDTEDADLQLSFYNGATYVAIANIGGGTQDTWLHYTYTTTDSQYFKTNFRIRLTSTLDGSWLDPQENVWIDDVLITAQVIP
jgi:FlaG/FlaF family flagellin (archaellin)